MSDSARSLEIARRMAELGRAEEAARAYELALREGIEDDPAAELEAAACVLQFGRDYQLPYKIFQSLHRRGLFRDETFGIMTGAFYEPNVRDLRSRYERNCKKLNRYPYCFRKDFIPFEDLPIVFYPYDDNGSYIPYYPAEDRFGELIDFKEPVIRHYFFKDLENPILAEDIFTQYELEYLNDNVRKSEYVARENHIYLHYTNWAVFCAYLQCWNLNSLLDDEKFVFLMEDEIGQYPIDFKARFGIDYSQYTVKPVGVREVNRLIWHSQLSSHNGGDFFNEVFDSHPNLIIRPSMLFSELEEVLDQAQANMESYSSQKDAVEHRGSWTAESIIEMYRMKGRTRKDLLVALHLNDGEATTGLDPASRIAPALFYQPHFTYLDYQAELDGKGRAVLLSKEYDQICQSEVFRHFKYIKTFTPMRRITTSHAASMRFALSPERAAAEQARGEYRVMPDMVFDRIINRSYLRDPENRLLRDSVLVRFEDGKLNPRATFTALAAFLDLPYTQSMTYCSEYGRRDPHPETKGFDPAPIYKTYDEYANDAERCALEYFMRDAYERYGYDFHYYDGGEMTEERVKELISGFTLLDGFICQTYRPALKNDMEKSGEPLNGKTLDEAVEDRLDELMERIHQERLRVSGILMKGLHFVNRSGQPLQFMTKLELDPALLEAPLYH